MLTDEEIKALGEGNQGTWQDDLKFARAVIAAYEKKLREQEPVYLFRRRGLDDFCSCTKGRFDELSKKPNRFEVKKLFEHPAPIPEGWQPIATAPKIGCHLAFDARLHTHPYVIVWLDAEHPDADEAGWHEHWSFDPVEPTHWMPLPPAVRALEDYLHPAPIPEEQIAEIKRKERERCAAVCEQYMAVQKMHYPDDPSSWVSAEDCAEAIRSLED